MTSYVPVHLGWCWVATPVRFGFDSHPVLQENDQDFDQPVSQAKERKCISIQNLQLEGTARPKRDIDVGDHAVGTEGKK